MAYIAIPQQSRTHDADELRSRIPGWGADLDPADRPSVPRERLDLPTGAHWEIPDQQEGADGREKSVEHLRVTPVFGTVAPLKGLSGVIRRIAYDRFSEGRAAHWLLLVLGDRVDSAESQLAAVARLEPDNLITETGVLSELKPGVFASRFRGSRADLKHQWMDPLIVAGPWLLIGGLLLVAARRGRK